MVRASDQEPSMQLSPHFTLAEMTRSQTAIRKGLPNVAPDWAIPKLKAVCLNILEPVREHFGRPVTPLSGWRGPQVNAAVGGAASSQHTKGEAVDFVVPGVSNLEVCQWMMQHLYYDQLIYEFGEGGWVHCSWKEGPLRNQELTARRVGGKTVYLSGILA